LPRLPSKDYPAGIFGVARESTAPMIRRCAPLLAGLCFVFALLAPVVAHAAPRVIPATPTTIAMYAGVLRSYNPQLPEWQSKDLARHLLVTAKRWQIDPDMLAAIVSVESSWHTHALSYAGAIGLGQLMPGTAAGLGVNPRDPHQNLEGAAEYLGDLMKTFATSPHRYEFVFAAYNAGPKAVIRYGGIPPYGETQHYVLKVLRAWRHVQSSVRIPTSALLAAQPDARGADVDYWTEGSSRY
jgi:soluble lytic murein transglycosylase-like protein